MVFRSNQVVKESDSRTQKRDAPILEIQQRVSPNPDLRILSQTLCNIYFYGLRYHFLIVTLTTIHRKVCNGEI